VTPDERRWQREYRRRARRGVVVLRVPVDEANFARAMVKRGVLSDQEMFNRAALERALALVATKIAREG
jgi:hypothetical protein